MLNKPIVTIAALAMGISGLAFGLYLHFNQPKYGYVVLTEVFADFQMKKEVQQKFEKEVYAPQLYFDSMAYVLQNESFRLDSMKDAPQTAIDAYLMKREKFIAQRQQFEQTKQTRTVELDQQIIDRMTQYIKDYGSQNGYTFIYGDDGNGNIMYADGTKNVTAEVVQYLNSRYQGQGK
jgi:outer membrane protein